MIIIVLTGGILSGKSTVAEMLEQLGAVIIDADKLGHDCYKPHTAGWSRRSSRPRASPPTAAGSRTSTSSQDSPWI